MFVFSLYLILARRYRHSETAVLVFFPFTADRRKSWNVINFRWKGEKGRYNFHKLRISIVKDKKYDTFLPETEEQLSR